MAQPLPDKAPAWLKQLVSYALLGCVAAGVDILVYEGLTDALGIDPLVSNVVSASAGITISFFLNRRFTFKVKDRPGRRYLTFFAIGLTGMCVQELLIWVALTYFAATHLIAKLVAVMTAGLMQLVLNKTISFRELPEKS